MKQFLIFVTLFATSFASAKMPPRPRVNTLMTKLIIVSRFQDRPSQQLIVNTVGVATLLNCTNDEKQTCTTKNTVTLPREQVSKLGHLVLDTIAMPEEPPARPGPTCRAMPVEFRTYFVLYQGRELQVASTASPCGNPSHKNPKAVELSLELNKLLTEITPKD